jgi:hypothetical protein
MTLALIQVTKDSTTKTTMNRKARLIIYALAAICALSLIANLVLAIAGSTPEEMKTLVAEQKATIEKLQRENSSLKKNTSPKKLDSENNVPANKADTEEEKKEKVSEIATSDKEQSDENPAVSSDIKDTIEDVIEILQDAAKETNGEKRKVLVNDAKRKLEPLANNPKVKSGVNFALEKLNNPIALQDETPKQPVKGHFNTIIKNLKVFVEQ